jgi:hypothetical protein
MHRLVSRLPSTLDARWVRRGRQRLAVLALLTSFASACEPQARCERRQVNAAVLRGDEPFRGNAAPTPTIHLTGERVSVRMVAPLTTCPTDQLRATFEVLAPDSAPVDHVATELVVAADRHVESTVDFTATQPGGYVVRAVFEPSLGVRATTVEVFANGAAAAVVVPLPAGVTCSKPAWPVSADTFACERPNEFISVVSADGGDVTFAGRNLVAVGDVLWSETPSGELERRELVDGGFVVTNSWPGFAAEPLRGIHTRTTAVRRRSSSNSLVSAVSIDGGVRERSFDQTESRVFFYEHDDAVRTAGGCEQCVVGLDPGVMWQQVGQGTGVVGYTRPIGDRTHLDPPQHDLGFGARFTTISREYLERWPLWLDSADRPGWSVLVTPRAGIMRWSAWPAGQVLRVGPGFVSLRADGGVGIAPLE